MEENKKPSNPRMHNPDGEYASEARNEDYVSLRDDFAGKAMQAIVSCMRGFNDIIQDAEGIAGTSNFMADAMVKQRELNQE